MLWRWWSEASPTPWACLIRLVRPSHSTPHVQFLFVLKNQYVASGGCCTSCPEISAWRASDTLWNYVSAGCVAVPALQPSSAIQMCSHQCGPAGRTSLTLFSLCSSQVRKTTTGYGPWVTLRQTSSWSASLSCRPPPLKTSKKRQVVPFEGRVSTHSVFP